MCGRRELWGILVKHLSDSIMVPASTVGYTVWTTFIARQVLPQAGESVNVLY